MCFFMMAYAYMADVTKEETRLDREERKKKEKTQCKCQPQYYSQTRTMGEDSPTNICISMCTLTLGGDTRSS